MSDDPDHIDTAHWRGVIEAAISALSAQSAGTRDDRAPVALDQQSVGRLARMDAMQVQAMAAATERRRAAEGARLKAALRRLDHDEFGWCESCGERIPDGRLAIDPATITCVACASGG